jgi:hypothetical protein
VEAAMLLLVAAVLSLALFAAAFAIQAQDEA